MAKKRPSKSREYRFKIDAYSPETMPLKRLAEYLADLAILFGEDKSVHLIKLEEGSTIAVNLIDREAEPKIRENLDAVARNDGPPERMRAVANINERLRLDNAIGVITDPVGGNLIRFPGRERVEPLIYGPFSQLDVIVGVPIRIGGKNDPVPVHLQDKDDLYDCVAKRDIAKDISPHLFTNVIRAEGIGRWKRHSTGEWERISFIIKAFKPLADVSLRDVIQDMREIPAEWKKRDDPIGELRNIRHGTDG